jgi:hypothetical protein
MKRHLVELLRKKRNFFGYCGAFERICSDLVEKSLWKQFVGTRGLMDYQVHR